MSLLRIDEAEGKGGRSTDHSTAPRPSVFGMTLSSTNHVIAAHAKLGLLVADGR